MIAQDRLNSLELEKSQLLTERKKVKSDKDRKRLDKQIHKIDLSIEPLKPYLTIQPGDKVFNGCREKIGTVRSKEFQNTLPVIWIDWGNTIQCHSPQSLTVVEPDDLAWHWLEGNYTRKHDLRICDDIEALLAEINRLKAVEDTEKKHRIIAIWDHAIVSKYPKGVDFFLDGERVTIEGYANHSTYKLMFPVVNSQVVHPLSLKPFKFNSTVPKTDSKVASESQNPDIILDSEFKTLLPPLTPEQRENLERLILVEGCRDALVIWAGKNILIDGYNRHEICIRNNIEFRTVELEFGDRDEVICWMICNQDARRNLDPDYASYLRGLLYRKTKKKRGGDRNSEGQNQHLRSKVQNDPLSLNKESTASKIAEKVGVSESTIKRDSDFTNDLEALANKVEMTPQEILSRKCSRKQIKKMTKLPAQIALKKLDDPNYIDELELPKLKPGDVVRVKSDPSNPDLIGHSRSIALVDTVYPNSVDIRIWQRLITNVPLHRLTPINGNTVTLNASVSHIQLIALMERFDSLEDAIASSLNNNG